MNRSFLFLLSGLFLLFMSASIRMVDATETACTMEYAPVCGMVPVQCVTEPCYPVRTDFSNMCMAKAAGATDITGGTCIMSESTPVLIGGGTDKHGCFIAAGYMWDSKKNKCIRPWEEKMSPRVALQAGSWTLVSYNGKTLTQSGTLTFEKGRFHAKLCNVMNGRYNVTQRGHLVTRQVISTKMYCEGEIMQVEQAMSGGGYTLSVGSNGLTLTTRKGDILIWKR